MAEPDPQDPQPDSQPERDGRDGPQGPNGPAPSTRTPPGQAPGTPSTSNTPGTPDESVTGGAGGTGTAKTTKTTKEADAGETAGARAPPSKGPHHFPPTAQVPRAAWRPYPLPDHAKLGTGPAVFQFEFHFVPEAADVPAHKAPYGHAFRALFMAWLDSLNPTLPELLHDTQRSKFDAGAVRPYAIDRRVEWDDRGQGRGHQDARDRHRDRGTNRGTNRGSKRGPRRALRKVRFTLNLLDEALGRAFTRHLFNDVDWQRVTFGPHAYHLEKVALHQVAPAHFTAGVRPVTKLRVRFRAPATFRSLEHGHDYRLPDPVALFTNLAHLWNATFPGAAGVDERALRDWVRAHLMVTSFDVKTVPAHVGNKRRVVGCVGWATYLVRDVGARATGDAAREDEGWCRWLHALARLGELTNVGHNRTAGLGVVRFKYEEFMS